MSFGLKKLLGKVASVSAALAISVGLVPASTGLGSIMASAADITVYNWAELKSNLMLGTKTVILGSDITAGGSDTAIQIMGSANVTLDLNGKTINRNLTSVADNGQIFINRGIFRITDSKGTGKITGAYHKTVGAIKNSGSGTLYFEGGTVTGNTAGAGGYGYGGGISNDGTLYMTGGVITNNKAVYGGGIYNDANAGGKVYISGGSITNNTALSGGGIYNASELHISGGNISGNIATGDTKGNKVGGVDSLAESSTAVTYISGNTIITGNYGAGNYVNVCASVLKLEGKLTNGARIGYYGTAAGTFTSGWNTYMSSAVPSSYFVSDNTNFSVVRSNNEAALSTGGSGPDPVSYYTVTFNANGGSGKMDSMIASSDSLFTLPECKFTPPSGQTFEKWDLGYPGASVKITKDTTIKAIWKGQAVTYCDINFSANGGSGSMMSDSVPSGSTYTLPRCEFSAPSGMSFAGWKVGSGSKIYKAGETITATGTSITVYAQWTSANCTVTFSANGGSGSMNNVTVAKGSSYTLPACKFTAPTGKEFAGWKTSSNSVTYSAGTPIVINDNTTLIAQWKTIVCTISFASNGGSGSMKAVNVDYGTKYTLPACTFNAPTGKQFSQWDKGAVNTQITVTSNITLTAQWKAIVCKITFAANGGSGSMSAVNVDYGTKYTLPACKFTAPANKVFSKWDKGAAGAQITVTSNTTLTAQWADVCTIKFAANGGTGTMTSVTVAKGSEYTLPACTFTAPKGKMFDKWDKGAAGTKITVTGNITLTAQWKTATALKGDVNGDGKVNVKDLTLLQKWINGWGVTINEANANFNGDNKINVKDLIAIQKYINSLPA